MKILNRTVSTLLFSVVMSLLVAGNSFAGNSATSLRLALLPIPDVLPVYVAEEEGYFKEAGIEVETLPVGSAVERDQLMQAGRIDGMINEVGGAALFNRDTIQMKIVSYARTPIGESPLFRVLVAPRSEISDVKELADVPIAISRNTVIEYITKRLLQKGGVADKEISFISVPVLPERLQLLISGQIQAATLPDPLGFAAVKAGAIEVTNDLKVQELSASVVSFANETLLGKEETVRKFMAAWARAVTDLNRDPGKYSQLMLDKIRVPGNVRKTFMIPPFPEPAVPTKAQWQDVQRWMVAKELLKEPVPYEGSVTDAFLAR